MTIPFEIPQKFLADYASGSLELYNAILKDKVTGQIVGHVQQTGALSHFAVPGQTLLQTATSLTNPVAGLSSVVSGVDTAFQLRSIQSKLDTFQNQIGVVQGLNIANLAVSAIGIGVTVASTAIIMSGMNRMASQLDSIEKRLETLPANIEAARLRVLFTSLTTQLERFEGRVNRNNREMVVLHAEEKLHDHYNHFADALSNLSQEQTADAALISMLIEAMVLSGRTSVLALMEMNDLTEAHRRATTQSQRFREIAWSWPDDKINASLQAEPENAQNVVSLFRAALAQQTTQPMLLSRLAKKGLSPLEFLRSAREEKDEPLLILPNK